MTVSRSARAKRSGENKESRSLGLLLASFRMSPLHKKLIHHTWCSLWPWQPYNSLAWYGAITQ